MSVATIAAVSCVADLNVVGLSPPLKLTCEAATKFVPFTVSVNAAPPATALVGESVVIVGTGLLIANGKLPVLPPPGAGVVTETLTVPEVAMSAAVIAAVNCVVFTNVVV